MGNGLATARAMVSEQFTVMHTSSKEVDSETKNCKLKQTELVFIKTETREYGLLEHTAERLQQ